MIEMGYMKRSVHEDLKDLKDKPISEFEAADSNKLIETVIENRKLIRDMEERLRELKNR